MAYPQMFQRHTLEATTISTAPWRRPVKNAAVRSSYHWLRTLKELIIASCETVDSLYTTDFDRGYPGLLPIMHFSIVNNWHRVHENESATGLCYPLAPPVGCTKSWWGCYGYWSYSLRERTDRAAHKDRLLNQSIPLLEGYINKQLWPHSKFVPLCCGEDGLYYAFTMDMTARYNDMKFNVKCV